MSETLWLLLFNLYQRICKIKFCLCSTILKKKNICRGNVSGRVNWPPPLVVYVMEIWIFICSTFSSKTFYSYFCWKNSKIQIVINNYKQITPKNKKNIHKIEILKFAHLLVKYRQKSRICLKIIKRYTI